MKLSERSAWLTSLALLLSSLALRAEEPAVVKDAHVNVRGQPSLVGEVITQLQQGEKVVILEEVAGSTGKTNEPPRWARIQMPANTPVWVYAPFVDTNSKAVKVTRLNLRAGPGENYSVVGRLKKSDPIKEIRQTGDWIEIETPPGAYGFVAADLLTKGPASAAATQPSTSPAPSKPETATTSTPPAKIEPKPAPQMSQTTPPPIVQTPPSQVQLAPAPGPAANTNFMASAKVDKPAPPTARPQTLTARPAQPTPAATVPAPAAPASSMYTVVRTSNAPSSAAAVGEAQPRRIVRREGLVRSTVSIQAPTYYELLNPDNRKTINYLHTDALGLDLKDYRGRRIVVSGEEAIDPRWPRTPVIEVEKLQLIP